MHALCYFPKVSKVLIKKKIKLLVVCAYADGEFVTFSILLSGTSVNLLVCRKVVPTKAKRADHYNLIIISLQFLNCAMRFKTAQGA